MENNITKRIERDRKRLHKIGRKKTLVDPEVVLLSQQLDKLLNKHYILSRYEQLSFW